MSSPSKCGVDMHTKKFKGGNSVYNADLCSYLLTYLLNPLQSWQPYTNDRFQMQAYYMYEVLIFRFRRTEKMDSVMKGLMGQCLPLRIFWARTAPARSALVRD